MEYNDEVSASKSYAPAGTYAAIPTGNVVVQDRRGQYDGCTSCRAEFEVIEGPQAGSVFDHFVSIPDSDIEDPTEAKAQNDKVSGKLKVLFDQAGVPKAARRACKDLADVMKACRDAGGPIYFRLTVDPKNKKFTKKEIVNATAYKADIASRAAAPAPAPTNVRSESAAPGADGDSDIPF